MAVTLNLRPEVEAGLLAQAQATGMSLEGYLLKLVENEAVLPSYETVVPEPSGMVMKNGLLVYRTGRALPAHLLDDAINRSREARSRQILGDIA